MLSKVKKKATVVMLIDVSGSMEGAKIKQAVQGATLFLDQMDHADEIYVIVFSDEIFENVFVRSSMNMVADFIPV